MNTQQAESLCLSGILQPATAGAISVAQSNDFEDGTLQDWKVGSPNATANHMTNIVEAVGGVGNSFLQLTADETIAFAGSRLTLFD